MPASANVRGSRGAVKAPGDKDKRLRREGNKSHSKVRTNKKSQAPAPTKVAVTAQGAMPTLCPTPISANSPSPAPPTPSVTQNVTAMNHIVQVPTATVICPEKTKVKPKNEQKGIRLIRDKDNTPTVEKDKPEKPTVVKGTVRKRNSKSSSSSENKKSAETEKQSKNRSPHQSSDSPQRKSSETNKSGKSEGSKEPSENEEKAKKRADELTQQRLAKRFQDNQKARERMDDARLEKMPESSQLNMSMRAQRKKGKQQRSSKILDSAIFKANGEPVWLVHELSVEEAMSHKNEDGDICRNPELVAAMAEDGVIADEYNWPELSTLFIKCDLPMGDRPDESFEPNPFDTMEELAKSLVWFTSDALRYNTVHGLMETGKDAVLAIIKNETKTLSPPRAAPPTPPPVDTITTSTVSTVTEPPPGTTPPTPTVTVLSESVLKFDFERTIKISYDRNHPLASIRKFRKKAAKTPTYSSNETTQQDTKDC